MIGFVRPRTMTVALFAMAAFLCGGAGRVEPPLIISGGMLYDGSTSTPIVGDVVIVGDRIAAIGPRAGAAYRDATVIDARGMVVAPGFIDPHTHSDALIWSKSPQDRLIKPWLLQGVTTVFTGVDGYGQGTATVRGLLDHTDTGRLGTNVATLVGFGAIRQHVLGNNSRAPSPSELQQMKSQVAEGMCEGAFGLSTGLFYAPQSFARTDEVVAVAREAAVRGGIYDTHQRDESSYTIGLVNSVREAIAIGREAGLPVHFAHIKALGVDVRGKSAEVVAIIDAARAQGQVVTADQYPYEASGSALVPALVPRWAQDGGPAALVGRLGQPVLRARIAQEMMANLARRGGAAAILLSEQGRPWTGQRLDAVARRWKIGAVDAAIRIILTEKGAGGDIVSFNMSQLDIERFMRQPWTMTGSDGSDGHPRMFGTFPEKYTTYVVGKQTLDLATFINSSTGRTADFYKLDRRGHLKVGYFADVLVFDPRRYRSRATYLHPAVPAEGVRALVVNGQVAVRNGRLTGIGAGVALRHPATPGTCDALRPAPSGAGLSGRQPAAVAPTTAISRDLATRN